MVYCIWCRAKLTLEDQKVDPATKPFLVCPRCGRWTTNPYLWKRRDETCCRSSCAADSRT